MTRAEIKRKFDEIVAFAEVEKFLDTPVKRYSSGMYVRLAFAVAAHLEPEILVVDEVLAVGDAEFQKKCLGKMQDVAGHGRTVLFVSHSMGAVTLLCHRAMMLAGGRVAMAGTTEEVVEQYIRGNDASCSAHFQSAANRPSITQISTDQDALRRGDLELGISFESPWPIRNPIGGIVLKALNGQAVWGSNARVHPRTDAREPVTAGVLQCYAKGLPLWPGEYVLSAWLSDWHEDHDSKIDALTIRFGLDSVDNDDPNRLPTSVNGHLDWPATWSIVKALPTEPCGPLI